MSTTPGTVLVIGEADGSADAIVDQLADGPAETVDTVPTVDDAVTALGPATDVGCVLVLSTDGANVEATCRACRDADADVPIVAALDSFEKRDLAPVTRVGDVRVISDDDPEAIAERVGDALETYERRSRRREDASMFRSFLSEIGVAMYVKDREGRHVRAANVPGARSPQDMLGKRDTEIYPDSEAAEQTLEDDLRVVEEATTIYGREEQFETDTGPQWLRTNKAPWRDDGQVRGVVGLTWDITDEMINQRRLAEREETFETFAKSLSHDVRTPLQVARGNLELLREQVEDDEPAERADDALDRITEMMQDLEEVAKAEGRETIETDAETDDTEFSFANLPAIREVAERVWSIIDTADATLDVEFDSTATVAVDETSLRPVLENLFTNAVRHGGTACR